MGYMNGGRPYRPGMPPQYVMPGPSGPYGHLIFGAPGPGMGGPGARPGMYQGPGMGFGMPPGSFNPNMTPGESMGPGPGSGRGQRPALNDDMRWRK